MYPAHYELERDHIMNIIYYHYLFSYYCYFCYY